MYLPRYRVGRMHVCTVRKQTFYFSSFPYSFLTEQGTLVKDCGQMVKVWGLWSGWIHCNCNDVMCTFLYMGPSGKVRTCYQVHLVWNWVHLLAVDLFGDCDLSLGLWRYLSHWSPWEVGTLWVWCPTQAALRAVTPGTTGNPWYVDEWTVFHAGQKSLCYFPLLCVSIFMC